MAKKTEEKTQEKVQEEQTIQENDIIQEEKVQEEQIIVTEKEKKPLDMNEYISVKSVTEGSLSYTDENKGIKYLWNKFGDVLKIKYEILQSMFSMYPSYFEEPNIVVEDERVIEELNLGYIYEDINMKAINDLDKILLLPPKEFEKTYKDLSENVKDNLKARAFTLIQNGKIDSHKTIKMLEKTLKVDFDIML